MAQAVAFGQRIHGLGVSNGRDRIILSRGVSDEQQDTAERAAERGQKCSSGGRSSGVSPYGTSVSAFAVTGAQVDFSSSYDINSHFNVCFEALSLNDGTFNTHGRFKEQVLDVVEFGRRFALGVNAKW
jgi:hypothetical protein